MSYSPKHDNNQHEPAETGKSAEVKTAAKKAPAENNKKMIFIGAAAVLVIIAVVMLVLILKGGNGSSSNYSPLYPDGVLPTSGSIHGVNVLPNGGKNAMEIEGMWKLDQVTKYEFDGYGRGIMHTAVADYSFVYSAENGLLEIDFDTDGGTDTEYRYVLEGDKLTITSGSKSYEFTKEIK